LVGGQFKESQMSYAVLDFETTGFSPTTGDRVVEAAVVLTDDAGAIEAEWTTLVNPHRDVGASQIHGLRGADLVEAPDFSEISDELLGLLSGRTLVAHNAPFDTRFLVAELQRAEYEVAGSPAALCTMRWSGRMLGASQLQQCCEALDIPLTDAHSALADARATSLLFGHLLHRYRADTDWLRSVQQSAGFTWPQKLNSRTGAPIARGEARPDPHAWLRTVLQASWVQGATQDEASYLHVLSSALLDLSISNAEGRQLEQAAQDAGLSRETALRLHHDFLRSMAQEAVVDGVVTPDERSDLDRAAEALGLGRPFVDEALAWAQTAEPLSQPPSQFALNPGDRIVFTGSMSRERDEWIEEIRSAGLCTGGITKATKLLVAADPDSLSGKAAKARTYKVPIVDEETFGRYFAAYRKSR
jgi:DNA polymerase III subunit epsilon